MLGGFGAKLADIGRAIPGPRRPGSPPIVLLVAGFSRALARDPRGWRYARLRLKSLLALDRDPAAGRRLAAPRPPAAWPLARGLGGFWGDALLNGVAAPMHMVELPARQAVRRADLLSLAGALGMLIWAAGLKRSDFANAGAWLAWADAGIADTAPPSIV